VNAALEKRKTLQDIEKTELLGSSEEEVKYITRYFII